MLQGRLLNYSKVQNSIDHFANINKKLEQQSGIHVFSVVISRSMPKSELENKVSLPLTMGSLNFGL